MPNTTFTQKILSFQFSLAGGSPTAGAANTATVTTSPPQGAHSGIRASANIKISGGDSTSGRLEAVLYGLPLSLMNQLTVLPGILNAVGDNRVTVQAGDADNGMALVFDGTIFTAYPDGNAPPAMAFHVAANADAYSRMKPAPSTSVAGTADTATLMGQLAGQMGLTLENNGVNVKVSNPYLWGPPRVQAQQLARMAGIQMLVDKGKLAIWPAGGARGGAPISISKDTGMIGYPRFSSASIVVQTLFTPAIEYGKQMTVQSEIAAANGTWGIKNLDLELESFMPRGKWQATIVGVTGTQRQQVSN
jgi:hypothetical protein